jgi:outer membrane PBP1 activator LpoA protein
MLPELRQRLIATAGLLSCVALLAGCPSGTVRPPPERPPDAAAAEKLVREGKPREAAQLFERLAGQAATPAERTQHQLRAAEQWLAAGAPQDAERVLALITGAVTAEQQVSRTLLEAETALLADDPARALKALRGLPPPANPALAARTLDLQARAQFASGNAPEGVKSLIARERWLSGAEALHANRQLMVDGLRTAGLRGASLVAPAGADPLVAGWLEFGTLLLELERSPFSAAQRAKDWRTRYPLHPANGALLDDLLRESAVALEYPAQVALLLPLTGRQQAAAIAVRDGFLSAYFQQAPDQRPRVRVYDVGGQDIGSALRRAMDEGAQFIVGPLTKDEVSGAAASADGRVPVLALNFLPEDHAAPKGFYQFALVPEDEARQVARRVVADGRARGVALVPTGEWGTRILAAFSDELGVLGGELLARGVYDPADNDYTPEIQQVLRLSDSRERYARVSSTLGVKLEFEPRRRGDVEFIFVAAQPAHSRLIRPQLRFHYAGDIPTYATSDAYEPDETANVDLDGIMFPDMPWMIANDPVSDELRGAVQHAWPARANRRGRLYAFGYDAYRLLPSLRAKQPGEKRRVPGMTGRLTIEADGRIYRDLDWAQIRDGKPRNLALAPAQLPAEPRP